MPAKKAISPSSHLLPTSLHFEYLRPNLFVNLIPNITVGVDTLPENATEVAQAHWNLTYYKGGGLGFGIIGITPEFSMEGTTLVVTLHRDYEYGQILPYFFDSEVTVSLAQGLPFDILESSPTIYPPFPYDI